jgi:hypothetical protein
VSFPVTLVGYSAFLDVENDLSFSPPASVLFTGPAGSGLSNTAADPGNSFVGSDYAGYQSPIVLSPTAAPGGAWVVNYRGTNRTFTVPDPQAASRLVIPVPTANVSDGLLQSVSWVYKNASTGATLGAPPAYLTWVQVQMEGSGGGRIYSSPELTPTTTSHTPSAPVNWPSIKMIQMAYNDTLGNHYVVSFSNP